MTTKPDTEMTGFKDCKLLELLRARDEQALVVLYDRYSRLVYSAALQILKNPATAEDVTQEVFIQLWHHPEQISITDRTLHGWLWIASRNRSISTLRKKWPEQLNDFVVVSPSVARHTEQRLMCETLINKLAGEQRMLLEMAFFQEMSHVEIAAATGRPLGTIKSKIRFALGLLRTSLSQTMTELVVE